MQKAVAAAHAYQTAVHRTKGIIPANNTLQATAVPTNNCACGLFWALPLLTPQRVVKLGMESGHKQPHHAAHKLWPAALVHGTGAAEEPAHCPHTAS